MSSISEVYIQVAGIVGPLVSRQRFANFWHRTSLYLLHRWVIKPCSKGARFLQKRGAFCAVCWRRADMKGLIPLACFMHALQHLTL